MEMDLQRYDIVMANIKYEGESSVQTNLRPYVIISNPIGTKHGSIITVMPLTSKIKKTNMPVHKCITANISNNLLENSMTLGEQIVTISKHEVKKKVGTITDRSEKRIIDQACFDGLFYGTDYRLEEANA